MTTDLDERLRADGQRWRDQLEPAPPLSGRLTTVMPRRRRWTALAAVGSAAAVAATVAVVAVVTGLGSGGGQHHASAPQSSSCRDEFAPGSATKRQSANGIQITVSVRYTGEADCRISGYGFEVDLLAGGRTVAAAGAQNTLQLVGPLRVDHDDTVSVTFWWTSACGYAHKTVTAAQIAFLPKGQRGHGEAAGRAVLVPLPHAVAPPPCAHGEPADSSRLSVAGPKVTPAS